MIILVSILLIYLAIGLILMMWYFRGFTVGASLGEWLVLILLWPFLLHRFYLFMSFLHRQERDLKEWAEALNEEATEE